MNLLREIQINAALIIPIPESSNHLQILVQGLQPHQQNQSPAIPDLLWNPVPVLCLTILYFFCLLYLFIDCKKFS
ncbi:hypothetical protein Avbf_12670 [Armadillidium vulgare]|nr:hypothetical protein Avbf_12670 [Armadillidium vulgare]